MKQILSDMTKQDIRQQPASVQRLACDMLIKAMKGHWRITSPILTDSQKEWLTDNEFTFSFNHLIYEWEIIIQEES